MIMSGSISQNTAVMMPTNFPSTNCRRLIGLESSVIAVLPSISSAMLVLDVQTASSSPQIRMVARPQSISILKSSPNEKNGKNVLVTRLMSERHQKRKERLADGFFG